MEIPEPASLKIESKKLSIAVMGLEANTHF